MSRPCCWAAATFPPTSSTATGRSPARTTGATARPASARPSRSRLSNAGWPTFRFDVLAAGLDPAALGDDGPHALDHLAAEYAALRTFLARTARHRHGLLVRYA